MAKKKSTTRKKKTTTRKKAAGRTYAAPDATGKHLVIVESPTKAKTINRYLGNDYVVMASVGHVRDLPSRNPKGVKQEVPGVDLENNFEPTYEVLPTKKKTVTQLKKAAKQASDVWFATDLDREGEAIAWHLAHALGVKVPDAKRVVFNAITKSEIAHAFSNPHNIDENKVNAQQARRILDRIVGYQVSPLLWKKVAGGLSAGRVQSVAVRVVVERERAIDAFIPDEYWKITGYFATDLAAGSKLAKQWRALLDSDENITQKAKLTWLSDHKCLAADLFEIAGKPVKPTNKDEALAIATAAGFQLDNTDVEEDPKGKGPAQHRVTLSGSVDSNDDKSFAIRSIQTKRTKSNPPPPFITSSLQQAAANRLGFPLQKTMRVAQQLYEGVDIHGKEGQTGLITYMRTDSTHLTGEALTMAREYIGHEWGKDYLPDKPNFYATKNQNAQEAHEAIRPTDTQITPKRVRSALTDDQYKLYRLIWERFLACQCTPAQWDATTVIIDAPGDAAFRASGRTLVFDGFYKAAGVPNNGDTVVLPKLDEGANLAPLQIDPTQHFTSPPPRYTEASLQKKLEEEGIGRPSTYAAIIQTIQDRKYVEPLVPRDKRLRATDLGCVVTDKLTESFPKIMDVAYTRDMEAELDKVEEEHHDWVEMLRQFYGPFRANLDRAHEGLTHAKAETQPAPYKCEKCGADTMYRFGKNGRFLSCTQYPECDYAAPIDREGKPQQPEMSDIVCPLCGSGMTRRVGRFGPFLGCANYPECKGIVNLDAKKGTVKLPKPPPLETDIPCPKCEDGRMNMRRSKRGPWLSCNKFPKCRGRVGFSALDEEKQNELEKALEKHEKANPVPQIRTTEGRIVDEEYIPIVETDTADAPTDSDAA
jgi:DNA topoisomerase-1